jgi:alpha-methylacyl-CoA racemase
MGQGPLSGVRVLEFAGIGPAPFCGMLLSDLGADVLRIDRPGGNQGGAPLPPARYDPMSRGRRSVAVDLKQPQVVEACLCLLDRAEIAIEGFRPGVMERLGLGPAPAISRNPKLVYGRMTGWGQTGPLAMTAGHDLNYISITGALHAIGPREKPVPPVNVVGDFGGGALYLAFGVVSALLHARATGVGQVVDAAASDGAASLMTSLYGVHAAGRWSHERASNRLDGGAHYYDTYRCADDKWVSVATIEPKFYALLLEKTGLDDPGLSAMSDRSQWAPMRERLAAIFARKSQAEWCRIMQGVDACFAPVLDLDEAPRHPHNVARETFVEIDGVIQPAPAPRFSRTPGAIQRKRCSGPT